MRHKCKQHYPPLLHVVIVGLLILCLVVAGFTAWMWHVRNTTKQINVDTGNAYCSKGSCYRTNGMYIGPDPIIPSKAPTDAKVPEFVPPDKN